MKWNEGYIWVWVLAGMVLLTGLLFPTLMDFDAAEYAGISMHMFQSGQWGTILNRHYDTGLVYDYLDKPHLLYWSAFPGFALFGIGHVGYRLVSVVMTFAAAWATYKTARLLYNRETGKMAGLFFVTAQSILLASHDVRTDTLLTAFCILSIYQFVKYIHFQKFWNLVMACAFLAAGVGTKGMIAVLVTGSAVGAFILFRPGGLKQCLRLPWAFTPLFFFLFLSPVLYFYYNQFDLHPEKFVNGRTCNSGIRFILWTQSFERFAGGRSLVDNPEFSFLFHSFLWVFLPWSLLAYAASFQRIRELITTRGKSIFQKEQLSFSGVWAMFLLMSFSSFKLPHYLNVLLPLFSIVTASYLTGLVVNSSYRALKVWSYVQGGICIVLLVLVVVFCTWFFPLKNPGLLALVLALAFAIVYAYRRQSASALEKVWLPSLLVVLVVNFVMNTHVYPQLATYQGGSQMARYIHENKLPQEQVYLYNRVYRSFDFYLGEWRPMLGDSALAAKLQNGESAYLFTDEKGKENLSQHFHFNEVHKEPDYHITQLSAKFLNPSTRASTYGFVYLLKLNSSSLASNR